MLTLLAYFDHQDIWYGLFQAGRSDDLPNWLQSCLESQPEFDRVMGTLVEYCLVEVRSASQSYSMHGCVHKWTLQTLNRELDPQLYWYAFDCVNASIDSGDGNTLGHVTHGGVSQHGVWLTYPRFALCDEAENGLSQRFDEAVWMASILQDHMQLSAAKRMYRRALAGQERALGPDHPSTLDTVNNLGSLYWVQGKLEPAEQMYQRVLAAQEQSFGPDHSSTLNTVHNLSTLYWAQGKLELAEQMYQRALVGREKPEIGSYLNSSHSRKPK